MAQQHFDRLTAIDASFLHQEGPDSHMHVGGARALRGPAAAVRRVPRLAARCACTSSRATARSCRSRPPGPAARCGSTTRPSTSSTTSARPRCPRPAPRSSSCSLTGADLLPAARPLQAAVGDVDRRGPRATAASRSISKTHHAMIDGIAGVDLAHGPVRPRARARRRSPHPDEAWQPAPRAEPGRGPRGRDASGLLRAGVRTATHAAGTLRAARAPRSRGAREAAEGLGEIVWAGLNPAPETPLNVEIGPHRRYAVVRTELDDFKLVKNAFGGTVNDVVLAVVSGALRDWLQPRGVRTEGLELRALVPVSIRAAERPRRARQPHRRDARPAARSTSRTRSRGCARSRAGDGRAQGVQAGGRRRGPVERAELRAADDPRPGLAAELLHAAVQPDRDERPRAAVPALRARPRAARTSSRSRSCPRTTRWPSRSCPTTAR